MLGFRQMPEAGGFVVEEGPYPDFDNGFDHPTGGLESRESFHVFPNPDAVALGACVEHISGGDVWPSSLIDAQLELGVDDTTELEMEVLKSFIIACRWTAGVVLLFVLTFMRGCKVR